MSFLNVKPSNVQLVTQNATFYIHWFHSRLWREKVIYLEVLVGRCRVVREVLVGLKVRCLGRKLQLGQFLSYRVVL